MVLLYFLKIAKLHNERINKAKDKENKERREETYNKSKRNEENDKKE